MNFKKKIIGVVISEKNSEYYLANLFFLLEKFELRVYALRQGLSQLREISEYFKVYLFDEDEELFGYMHGLEKELEKCDAVICYGFGRFSSLQSLKFCDENSKSLIVYSLEEKFDIYAKFKNLSQTVSALLEKSEIFLCRNEKVLRNLQNLNISESRLFLLPLKIDPAFLSKKDEKRKKFRSYLKFKENEKIILYIGPFVDNELQDLVIAFSKIENKDTFTMLLAGNGSRQDELANLCSKLGIGSKVQIINQNIQNFLFDLLAASDYLKISKEDSVSLQDSFLPNLAAALGLKIIDEAKDLEKSLRFQMNLLESEDKIESIKNCSRLVLEYFLNLLKETKDEHQLLAVEKNLIENYESGAVKLKDLNLQLLDNFRKSRNKTTKISLSFNLVHFLSMNEDYNEAFSISEEILALDKNNEALLLQCANLNLKMHENEEALSRYKQILAVNPAQWEAFVGSGIVYKKNTMWKEAQKAFEKAISLDSSKMLAYTLLIQTLHEAGDHRESLLVLNRVFPLAPNFPPLAFALGHLYLKIGEYKKAEEYFSQDKV